MIICYIQYPDCWWGIAAWEDDGLGHLANDSLDRGVIRFSLPCKMLIPLFIFYYFNKSINLKQKINWAAIGVLGILLLMIGNRYPLALTVVIVFIMYMYSSKLRLYQKVYAVMTIIVFSLFIYIIPFTNNIVSSLVNRSNQEYEGSGENNIRVLAATYFFTDFNEGNAFNKIFGNGIYVPKSNPFSEEIDRLKDDFAFYTSDVGYCQIYLFYGLIGILGLFLWYLTSLKLKVPKKGKFIKIYFTFLMLSMIAGGYWFENIVIVAMLSYVLSEYNKQFRMQRICKTESCQKFGQ